MKYLSLFSGIGGFELGIQQSYEENCNRFQSTSTRSMDDRNESCLNGTTQWGFATCIGFSEIDKYAIQIYQKHFPKHKAYGDITKINEKELPDFDLLVGGFPCQSFSIAGKRGGFNDTRGTMFFEIARILKHKQPRLLLLENVKGLLSHDEGRTFATIIATLDELGYDLQWQVLNSKNFGVPQNRERVFIIGHLRGTGRPQVFPIGENDQTGLERNSEEQRGQIGAALTVRNASGNNARGNYVAVDTRQVTRETVPRFSEKVPTLNASMWKDPYSVSDGFMVRKLTPKECERLQGFPDGWTEGLSDTQRYKTLGNAVTVNVIQAIFDRIMKI